MVFTTLHFSIDFFQIRQIIGKQSRLTVKKVTMKNQQHELNSSTNSNISTTRYGFDFNTSRLRLANNSYDPKTPFLVQNEGFFPQKSP